jgi:hypothetical protein
MAGRLERVLDSLKNLFGSKKEKELKPMESKVKMKPKLKPKPRAKPKLKRKKKERIVKNKIEIEKKNVLYPESTTKKIMSVSPTLQPEKQLSEQEKKETVSTKIDDMIKILEKGPKDFSNLSKLLGIPENLVEDWAKILEEDNMVEISYVPIGSPVVKLKAKEAS